MSKLEVGSILGLKLNQEKSLRRQSITVSRLSESGSIDHHR